VAKSKLKNIILSLMAIQAEMRGAQHAELGKIVDQLKKFTEGVK
jgi:hypothetical protein